MSFQSSRGVSGRPRLAEKQYKRTHDQHDEHQDLELVDDRDEGRLLADHAVERSKPRLGDCISNMRDRVVGREVLGEREVHCLSVVVEEHLYDRDADRASIDTRQIEECGAFRAEFRIERAERRLGERRKQRAKTGTWSRLAATTSRQSIAGE